MTVVIEEKRRETGSNTLSHGWNSTRSKEQYSSYEHSLWSGIAWGQFASVSR